MFTATGGGAHVARLRIGERMHPVLLGGTVAGILDILAAAGLRMAAGGSPWRMLQGIAGGLLGSAAFQGGTATALLGLALHFVIAFTAAALYYAASKRAPLLIRRPIACGAAYGVAVYVVMNFVVVPLSRIGFRMPAASAITTMLVVHIVCVGLPIAWAVSLNGSARRQQPVRPRLS